MAVTATHYVNCPVAAGKGPTTAGLPQQPINRPTTAEKEMKVLSTCVTMPFFTDRDQLSSRIKWGLINCASSAQCKEASDKQGGDAGG